MSNLAWRRCPSCGQLTLVPANAQACWQCGAPMAGRRADADVHSRGMPGTVSPPAAGGTTPVPVAKTTPAAVRFGDLTPEEDAVARRLLASVFPGGVGL